MTDREKRNFHILFNLLLVVLIATFETSLWHQIFSPVPNPQLWIAVVVFVFLYRSPVESLLIVYIPSLFLYMLTVQPLGYLLLAQTLLFILVMAVKNRIFIPGQFYFSVIFSLSVLVFQMLLYTFSWVFETNTTSLFEVLGWFVQSIVAFLVSPFIYKLLRRLNPPEEVVDNSGDTFL